jgi:hypothetical protein
LSSRDTTSLYKTLFKTFFQYQVIKSALKLVDGAEIHLPSVSKDDDIRRMDVQADLKIVNRNINCSKSVTVEKLEEEILLYNLK